MKNATAHQPRERLYKSNAEKQRAYRQRLKRKGPKSTEEKGADFLASMQRSAKAGNACAQECLADTWEQTLVNIGKWFDRQLFYATLEGEE